MTKIAELTRDMDQMTRFFAAQNGSHDDEVKVKPLFETYSGSMVIRVYEEGFVPVVRKALQK